MFTYQGRTYFSLTYNDKFISWQTDWSIFVRTVYTERHLMYIFIVQLKEFRNQAGFSSEIKPVIIKDMFSLTCYYYCWYYGKWVYWGSLICSRCIIYLIKDINNIYCLLIMLSLNHLNTLYLNEAVENTSVWYMHTINELLPILMKFGKNVCLCTMYGIIHIWLYGGFMMLTLMEYSILHSRGLILYQKS